MSRNHFAGIGFFAVLVFLAGIPFDAEPFSVAILLACALAFSLTVGWLLAHGATMAVLTPVLHGLAYFPSAYAALSAGILTDRPVYVSAESAQTGLMLATGFACSAGVLSLLLSRSPPVRSVASVMRKLAIPFGPRLFLPALTIVFATAAIFGFQSGRWSTYGTEVEPITSPGGVRPELYYSSMVLVSFVYVSVGLTDVAFRRAARPQERASAGDYAPWVIALIVLTALLYIAQSRRAMVAVAAIWMSAEFSRAPLWASRPRWRGLLALASAVVLVVAGFVISVFWRGSLVYNDDATVLGRVVNTVEYARTEDTDVGEVAEQQARRFTYLWLESAAVGYFSGRFVPWDLGEVMLRAGMHNTPGILLPDKYDYPMITCEAPFELLGVTNDLPCTASAEGLIFGGLGGLLLTLCLWGLGLGIVQAVAAHRGPEAFALATAMVLPFCKIEASAFPIFASLRAFMVIGLTLGGLALAVKVLTTGEGDSAPVSRRSS